MDSPQESREAWFTSTLFERYEQNKKKYIPKATYFAMIEDLKGSTEGIHKSRQQYYLLTEDPNLDLRQVTIRKTRRAAAANLEQQAERMVKRSRVELARGQENDNVAVPIPMVDRGRGDPRNILGVILSIDENDMYVIGTRAGVLSGKYSRNQFSLCPQPLLKVGDINTDVQISLREAVKALSNSGGQGFIKCNCTSKCGTNRCKCFKAKLKCNSRCHNSLSCPNK